MHSLSRAVYRGAMGALRSRAVPVTSARAQSTYPIDDDVFGLNDEQKALRRMVSEYAQKRIAPLASKLDATNECPEMRAIWKELGSLGLLGVTAPQEYGGAGGTYLDHCIVMEELSRACAAIGLAYGAHSNLCVNQIVRNGNAAQRERYLPKLISGEHIGALAMSETTSGSDVVSMRLRAEEAKDRSGWYLTGHKFWITNALEADVVFVYAKTARADPKKKTKDAISPFLVERGYEGFSSGKKIDKMGMRGPGTGELIFDRCFVPREQLVGELHKGVYVLMSGLDYERLVLSAGPIGIMQAAVDVAFQYAHDRRQFGSPIASFQLIQGKMADMLVRLQATRALVYSIARSVQNARKPADCAGAILYAGEAATKVALDAVQILGGNGYTRDFPAERLVRDAKLYEIGAGTSEVRRIVIARNISTVYESSAASERRATASEAARS